MRRMQTSQRYWFSAMRTGYGWGAPQTWEGWLVLVAYLAVVLAPAALLSERKEEGILAAVVLATQCWCGSASRRGSRRAVRASGRHGRRTGGGTPGLRPAARDLPIPGLTTTWPSRGEIVGCSSALSRDGAWCPAPS
jgi:hypothetical protein